VDVCPECGYEYAALPGGALAPALALGAAQHAARLRAAPDRLRARPAPEVWSPLEYACHVRDVLRVQRERLLRTQSEDQPAFAPMDRERRVVDDAYDQQDPARVAEELRDAAEALAETLDDIDWTRTGVYNWPTTAVRDVGWIARHTLHEVAHHLMDVDRGLGAAGHSSSGVPRVS
jgi:S-DNA-T family DNA segregation ATPase FtsK/SpoIIIE